MGQSAAPLHTAPQHAVLEGQGEKRAVDRAAHGAHARPLLGAEACGARGDENWDRPNHPTQQRGGARHGSGVQASCTVCLLLLLLPTTPRWWDRQQQCTQAFMSTRRGKHNAHLGQVFPTSPAAENTHIHTLEHNLQW
jgi:hypothetical protein